MTAADAGPATVATTCPYCGVGCGVLATPQPDGRVTIAGDPAHPANRGRLCAKGAALGETLGLEGRLLHPEVGRRVVSWDEALGAVARGFARTIAEHGPESVAFYVSGQLLTEDYYVANKLMKGFLGSANIDTNSRLCMATAVAAHKRAFGADAVPGCYEDLEAADLIVLVGSNAAWTHPVLFQRIVAAKEARPDLKLVVIDPRRTASCEPADLHLALKPGADAWLFNGLLDYLRREDALDWEFLEHHTEGQAAAFASARAAAPSVPAVAAACELPEAAVAEFFRLYARTARTVTLFSQGVNQSASGVDKANAIINCHLATGRIGGPGMGPFSLTGQPNAMGGREVGGLANQLAAHMALEDPAARARVARFWDAPNLAAGPGLKAVELFQAAESGRIQAIWIMATNPVVSLPDAERVRAALRRCPLVVVSDCVRDTDTTACADILLPAAAWGEKHGTVTNSERRLTRQRAFRTPPGEARPDWWIVTQVARRLGFGAAFAYERPADIFREHARLSALDNAGSRAFDIGALAALDDEGYERLAPVRWPVTAAAPAGTARLFGDRRFHTPTGRARLIAVEPRLPARGADGRFPLILNTGRARDQWHTMTRTGRSARLSAHMPEPAVEVHPADAAAHGLRDGGLARLENERGEVWARVAVRADQRPGSVFVPMHWSAQFASRARVGVLIAPVTDPLSGQPESKHTPVRLRAWHPAWHGFVLTRGALDLRQVEYWSGVRAEQCYRYEIAGACAPEDWAAWTRALIGADGDWLDFRDPAGGRYRGACLRAGRLQACVFISPGGALPPRSWLAGLFAAERLDPAARASLLTGGPAQAGADAGDTVCACLGVGRNTLVAAIRGRRLATVAAVGEAVQAGTQCGSCRPELARLIRDTLG